MITSKPANGAEGQDMKLFYRIGASSGNFFYFSLVGTQIRHGQREGTGCFVFAFKDGWRS